MRPGPQDNAPQAGLPGFQVDPFLAGNPLDEADYFGVFFDLDLRREVFFSSCSVNTKSQIASPTANSSEVSFWNRRQPSIWDS
jgi:hypothetical protein